MASELFLPGFPVAQMPRWGGACRHFVSRHSPGECAGGGESRKAPRTTQGPRVSAAACPQRPSGCVPRRGAGPSVAGGSHNGEGAATECAVCGGWCGPSEGAAWPRRRLQAQRPSRQLCRCQGNQQGEPAGGSGDYFTLVSNCGFYGKSYQLLPSEYHSRGPFVQKQVLGAVPTSPRTAPAGKWRRPPHAHSCTGPHACCAVLAVGR